METNRRTYDSLTGLKGIMCLVIALFHTMPDTPLIAAIPFTALIRYLGGNLANGLFFMVSGFLMVSAYRDRIQGGNVDFGPFLWDKICKFYPIYLLTNGLALVFDVLEHGLSAITLQKVSLTLLLQQGGILDPQEPYNGPSWFVNTLLACYIVFFAVCRLAKGNTAYRCAIAGATIWGYIAMTGDIPLPLFHYRMGIGLTNFFVGCAIGEIYPLLDRKTNRRLGGAALLGLAGSLLLILECGVDNALGEMKVALCFALEPMLLYAALAGPLFERLLSLAPLRALGRCSTSVFFWHIVVFDAAAYVNLLVTGTRKLQDLPYLIYLVALLAVSVLSGRYLEKGLFRNFGKGKV